MARRSPGFFELSTRLPWRNALLLGFGLYVFIAHLLPGMLVGAFAQALKPALVMVGVMTGGACALGGLASLIVSLKQRQLYDSQKSLDQIRALGWKDFEHLMAEAFRRQGYTVSRTDPGPDGGVDLILEKDGEIRLVQCKQWRNQRVGVKPVRELKGVVSAEGASCGIFVCSGDYTTEAASFARRAGIELIDGRTLAGMLQLPADVQPTTAEQCPRCGSELVERVARRGPRSGQSFFGCASFPRCRYRRNG